MSPAPNREPGKADSAECGVREDRARLSGIRPSSHERGEQPTEGVRPVARRAATVHRIFPKSRIA